MYRHNLKLRYYFKKVELVGYDYSYRTSAGQCKKPYNLLTEKYWVVNDFYDIKTEKIKIEKFSRTKKQKREILT